MKKNHTIAFFSNFQHLISRRFFRQDKKRGHAIGAASYVFCIIRLVSRSPHRPNPHLHNSIGSS